MGHGPRVWAGLPTVNRPPTPRPEQATLPPTHPEHPVPSPPRRLLPVLALSTATGCFDDKTTMTRMKTRTMTPVRTGARPRGPAPAPGRAIRTRSVSVNWGSGSVDVAVNGGPGAYWFGMAETADCVDCWTGEDCIYVHTRRRVLARLVSRRGRQWDLADVRRRRRGTGGRDHGLARERRRSVTYYLESDAEFGGDGSCYVWGNDRQLRRSGLSGTLRPGVHPAGLNAPVGREPEGAEQQRHVVVAPRVRDAEDDLGVGVKPSIPWARKYASVSKCIRHTPGSGHRRRQAGQAAVIIRASSRSRPTRHPGGHRVGPGRFAPACRARCRGCGS